MHTYSPLQQKQRGGIVELSCLILFALFTIATKAWRNKFMYFPPSSRTFLFSLCLLLRVAGNSITRLNQCAPTAKLRECGCYNAQKLNRLLTEMEPNKYVEDTCMDFEAKILFKTVGNISCNKITSLQKKILREM